MPSTVTASTITAITSSSSSSVISLNDFAAALTVVAFVALLVRKEIVSMRSDETSRCVARGLNIALVPLGYAFLLISVDRLIRALS